MESKKVILPFAKLNQRIVYHYMGGKITFHVPQFSADQKEIQTYCQQIWQQTLDNGGSGLVLPRHELVALE
jgi:hypothetical protein